MMMIRRMTLLGFGFVLFLAACATPIDYAKYNEGYSPCSRSLFNGYFNDIFNKAFDHYLSLPGKKAFAMAKDSNQRWSYAIGQSPSSQSTADAQALGCCERGREHYGVQARCSIYAVGGDIVRN